MIIMPMRELKLEGKLLIEEFGFISIPQAHNEFCHLMLTRMCKKAKLLQVDFKPFYLQEGDLYNPSIPDEEDAAYSSI